VSAKPGNGPATPNDSEVTYSYPNSKVFVGGLDFNLTSEELKDHFQRAFGEV